MTEEQQIEWALQMSMAGGMGDEEGEEGEEAVTTMDISNVQVQ
jgi:hypothetical protein